MRTLMLVIAAAGALVLSACNTTIGMSRDIRALGAGMENVATGRDFEGESRRQVPNPPPPPVVP